MRRKHTILVGTLSVVFAIPALGQGTFQNLDFEMAIQPLVRDANFEVPIATALHGWQAYIGPFQVDRVVYNTMSLGAASIEFHGLGSSLTPFHGNYLVAMQSSFPGGELTPSIAQVGQIPASARSLIFYAYNVNIQVSFGGQGLTSYDPGSAAPSSAYRKIGIDLSGLAGQTGELRFSAGHSGGNLDYIWFSTQAIPEPNAAALAGLGVAWVLAWRARQ